MARVVREWTLTDEIGRGGMGVVYRATHEILHGDWAVKVIRPELSEDKESRLRFLQEASTLARMQHPNIVSIQTPFQEGGQIYLPMEFLNGQSLEQILKADGTAWPAERAVNVIRQAAAGLGYAHRQSPAVLHRDIKPGNIQVLDDGRVKVLDFGLARTLGDKSMTGTGKAVGTPAYMAPEVLDGRKATERSDVYSLGVVLYRLLAGRLPFDMPEEDLSIQAVFMAVARGLERGLPDVRNFAPLTPPALADLTMRSLSRAPEGRPANGAELAGFLANADTTPIQQKTHKRPDYSADSTCLGIDLDSQAGSLSKPSVAPVESGSSVPLGPSAPPVSSMADADRSLLGIDLHGSAQAHSANKPSRTLETPVLISPRKIEGFSGIVESVKPPTVTAQMPSDDAAAAGRLARRVNKLLDEAEASESAGDVSGAIRLCEEVLLLVPGHAEARPLHESLVRLSSVKVSISAASAAFTPPQPPLPVVSPPPMDPQARLLTALQGYKLARIPGGSFQMGSTSKEASRDENHIHQVNVQSFEMLTVPVTQRLWESVMYTSPSRFKGMELPVEQVSWREAVEFCNALSRAADLPLAYKGSGDSVTCDLTCTGFRLPTEAEWEYAARAGTTGERYGEIDAIAWCYKNSGRQTHPVGQKQANRFGLNDMLGNVWEWCHDWYHDSYKGAPSNGSAWESPPGSNRVRRGGSWYSGANDVRAAGRYGGTPDNRTCNLGLRTVRSVR